MPANDASRPCCSLGTPGLHSPGSNLESPLFPSKLTLPPHCLSWANFSQFYWYHIHVTCINLSSLSHHTHRPSQDLVGGFSTSLLLLSTLPFSPAAPPSRLSAINGPLSSLSHVITASHVLWSIWVRLVWLGRCSLVLFNFHYFEFSHI